MSTAIEPGTAGRQQIRMNAEAITSVWRLACLEVSAELAARLGSTVAHQVEIVCDTAADGPIRTRYQVQLDVPSAPEFLLSKRASVDGLQFEDTVAVETQHRAAVSSFLTNERRLMTQQLMVRMTAAEVRNDRVTAWSDGVDTDLPTVKRTVRRLVAVAEAFSPSWVDIALNQEAVVHDLFAIVRDTEDAADRFDDLYLGAEVSWRGEVLQAGGIDRAGRRLAVLVGGSSQRRVVALIVVPAKSMAQVGDVINFDGSLCSLDPEKRLFRIE